MLGFFKMASLRQSYCAAVKKWSRAFFVCICWKVFAARRALFKKHRRGNVSRSASTRVTMDVSSFLPVYRLPYIRSRHVFQQNSERAIQPRTLFLLYVYFFTLWNLIQTHRTSFFVIFFVCFHASVQVLQEVVINAGNEWRFSKLPRTLPCCWRATCYYIVIIEHKTVYIRAKCPWKDSSHCCLLSL